MLKSLSAISLALLLSLIAATGATAAVTFGDPLDNDPNNMGANYVLVQVRNADDTIFNGSPVAGVMTSVSIEVAGPSSMVDLLFLRPASPLGATLDLLKIAPNITVTTTTDDSAAGHMEVIPTRVPVIAGDRVGLSVVGSSTKVFQTSGGASTDTCAFRTGLDGTTLGSTTTYTVSSCNQNSPGVRATVEPDADADGYGDESQDLCASDATRQTACALVAPPPLSPPVIVLNGIRQTGKVSSQGRSSFVLTNQGQTAATLVPFSVKSSKSVRKLRIVKGCKPAKSLRSCVVPAIAPGQSVTIKVRLEVKSALRTTLTAKSGALEATTTVKLKRRKK